MTTILTSIDKHLCTDIETQTSTMKSHDLSLEINQSLIENSSSINKIFYLFIIIVFIQFPIIFCDIYFSQQNYGCIHTYSNLAQVNMQTYLLVSGIIEIIMIIILLLVLLSFVYEHTNKINLYILLVIYSLQGLFLYSWTIVGGVVFWSYVYKLKDCSYQINNYIFASLIIKLTYYSFTCSSSYKNKN